MDCASITARQRDVLSILLTGATLVEVAELLGLSRDTVKMHVRRTHAAVGTHTLHGLAVWGVRHRECCSFALTT